MKINLIITLVISSLTILLGQPNSKSKIDKANCKANLESKTKNLDGEWKFITAKFYPTKGQAESKTYTEHSLVFDKDKFSVKAQTGNPPFQTGKIKVEKLNPSKALNCECTVWFKSKNETPFNSWDTLGYYDFWTVDKCTTDSLILLSPWTCDFIAPGGEQKRCGMVQKFFIRRK